MLQAYMSEAQVGPGGLAALGFTGWNPVVGLSGLWQEGRKDLGRVSFQAHSGCWQNVVPVFIRLRSHFLAGAGGWSEGGRGWLLLVLRGLSLVLPCGQLYLRASNGTWNPSHAWNCSAFLFYHISLPPAKESSLLFRAHVIRLSQLDYPG